MHARRKRGAEGASGNHAHPEGTQSQPNPPWNPSASHVTAPVPSARQLFSREAARPDAELDLARAALLVAREEYAQLPVELYLARLDQLAEEVRDRLSDETAPPVVLQELLATLYERHGFKGNRDAYYDPRNSYLNDVLDRRLGIPLTLGMVLLEVGWRLDLPLEGVNFPHHFLVRYRGDAVDLLIDPFDGGHVRFEDQAQEFLDRVYGGMVRVRPSFLKTASRRDMLVRLLTNLKGVYLNVSDDPRAAAALERILLLRPDATAERRMLGVVFARMGRPHEAERHLRAFLDEEPGSPEAPRVRALLEGLHDSGRGPAGDPDPESAREEP
jgi:regulator of sirC expression with transglutaminase-like and TPR domain